MVATKMFWDMWRNLTNATSNWTISSPSSSSSGPPRSSSGSSRSKFSRYNRLRSPPTKSHSQPANLAEIAEASSSLESLNMEGGGGGGGNDDGQVTPSDKGRECSAEAADNDKVGGRVVSLINSGGGHSSKKGKKPTIKHSFTTGSFLSFSVFRAENECRPKSGLEKKGTSGKGLSGISDAANNAPRISTAARGSGGGGTQERSETQEAGPQKQEYCMVQHVITDLDEEDGGDHIACDVCDRAFPTFRKLADHQRKKRHYGCVQCDTLFPNREGLDIHREQMCHYEFAVDLAGYRDYVDENDDSDSFVTDDDENGFGYSDDGDDEEMERLL